VQVRMEQVTNKQIIIETQEYMEMPYTRRQMDTTARVARGTKTARTSLTRAVRSSSAVAVTALPLMRACSISTATMAMLARTTASARSVSHFNVTLILDTLLSGRTVT